MLINPPGLPITIIGSDPTFQATLTRVRRVAPTRLPVLVTGESGTGKELVAQTLHDLGPSRQGPFVAVNCGALARELAESELFGHERGAFTGAAGRRAGWFEEADGGTLILDEVGELPAELQPKLLRALETGRIRRVGGSGERPITVRVVAMTLRDLRADAQRGRFRVDLYHRLAGLEITLPPLRQRLGDLPTLARHFLDELIPELGERTLSAPALRQLLEHEWPGNVRELRNVMRRAALLSDDVIGAEHLELGESGGAWAVRAADGPSHVPPSCPPVVQIPAPGARRPDVIALPGRRFREIEADVFAWALQQNGGSRRQAASALGVSRSTFCDRVKRYGIA
jgi:two-component system nitrogen regulation response regulator GlnG